MFGNICIRPFLLPLAAGTARHVTSSQLQITVSSRHKSGKCVGVQSKRTRQGSFTCSFSLAMLLRAYLPFVPAFSGQHSRFPLPQSHTLRAKPLSELNVEIGSKSRKGWHNNSGRRRYRLRGACTKRTRKKKKEIVAYGVPKPASISI